MTMFSDGLQKPAYDYLKRLTPEELKGKTCGGCERCESRMESGFEQPGYHCTAQPFTHEIHPEDPACKDYWDRQEHEAYEKECERRAEARRKELWKKYSHRPPVKLPIVFDGYGSIPECPVCGEMPYSTKQCHWCGQHFIQDDEVMEYERPKIVSGKCPRCGKPIKITVSEYNGHKSGTCQFCGCSFTT